MNESFVVEDKSFSDIAIEQFNKPAESKMRDLVELSNDDYERLSCFLPAEFYKCVFVGHKATDLDSIASAVGCAELFNGVAARASNVNSESRFALEYWNIPMPAPFLEVVNADSRICIVDHNQAKQCPDGIDFRQVVGCIDHHAMQGNTISTSAPIHVDIKPWGSACTIVAHMFFRAKKKITRKTAGMLLSGILSDTLNLRSPTTTEHDGLAVALLAKLAEVNDTNELARNLFKAKSQELLMCTPHQLVRGDIKTFECRCPNTKTINISFGVIETTDPSGLHAIRDQLALELRALKQEEKKDIAFLAFVDIVNLTATLLLVGSRETDLASTVFKGEIDPVTGLMNLGSRVSRKKDFIPPLERAIADGYELPPLTRDEALQAKEEQFGEVALECGEHGCQTVRRPPLVSSTCLAQRFIETFRHHHHIDCDTDTDAADCPENHTHDHTTHNNHNHNHIHNINHTFGQKQQDASPNTVTTTITTTTTTTEPPVVTIATPGHSNSKPLKSITSIASVAITANTCDNGSADSSSTSLDNHIFAVPQKRSAVEDEEKNVVNPLSMSLRVHNLKRSRANSSAVSTPNPHCAGTPIDCGPGSASSSFRRIASESSLELARSASAPLRETLQDPTIAPMVEMAVKHLVDSVDLETMKHLMDPSFTLPTADQYFETLHNIAMGDDPSLKFLVMAFAHSFERDGVVGSESECQSQSQSTSNSNQ